MLARLLFASEILLVVVIDEAALVAPSPGVVIVDSLSSGASVPGLSLSGKAMVMVRGALLVGALLVGTSSYSSYPGGSSG